VLSKSRLMVVVSMMLLIALTLISITITAQFGATPSQYYTTQVIMNLENGQQNFTVPHVYQGDNNGTSINLWPMYLNPLLAGIYWNSTSHARPNQPVLELTTSELLAHLTKLLADLNKLITKNELMTIIATIITNPSSAGNILNNILNPAINTINALSNELTSRQYNTAGVMFWNETYNGGLVKITIVGTYFNTLSFLKYSKQAIPIILPILLSAAFGIPLSSAQLISPLISELISQFLSKLISHAVSSLASSFPPADGFEIYLFLNPTTWGVSPAYNNSIPYTSTIAWKGTTYPSLIEGDVIYPQSSTPYIVVQWDPYWQIGNRTNGATGQWNVWVVSNTNGNNPSVNPSPSPNIGSPYAGWDGIGTGYFQPNPGDLINITVTYDPRTNTLTGVATDLNTGQSANFTLNLGNYYTPPSSGNYVFGVGASGGGYANWALLYVAVTQQVLTSASANVVITEPAGFSAVPIWAVVVDAVAIVIIAISTTILIMSRRRR